MFREKYKDANSYIDSQGAKDRVQKRLESASIRRINWQQITAIAACFVIAVAGFSLYENKNDDKDVKLAETPQLARMADVEGLEIAVGEPVFDMAECEDEDFQKITDDGSYTKRMVGGVSVYEKTTGDLYECWIKKDGKITRITAECVTDEKKDEIILSVLQ